MKLGSRRRGAAAGIYANELREERRRGMCRDGSRTIYERGTLERSRRPIRDLFSLHGLAFPDLLVHLNSA